MIPQEIIDQLLDQLDIVEVIREYIQLKRAGRNFKACCPFHNEKTPSFVVSPEKQIYHCFGCSAGGNVIGFVMEHEKLSFPEAVEMLADKAGVEIPRYKKRDEEEYSLVNKLYEANDVAAGFYEENLRSIKGKRAIAYLKNRGFTADTVRNFRIGYAPDDWESFRKYAEAKKIPA